MTVLQLRAKHACMYRLIELAIIVGNNRQEPEVEDKLKMAFGREGKTGNVMISLREH